MDDQQLIAATRKAAENLSYYNAAEVDCWRQEAKARQAASAQFKELRKKCEDRDLHLRDRDYLI